MIVQPAKVYTPLHILVFYLLIVRSVGSSVTTTTSIFCMVVPRRVSQTPYPVTYFNTSNDCGNFASGGIRYDQFAESVFPRHTAVCQVTVWVSLQRTSSSPCSRYVDLRATVRDKFKPKTGITLVPNWYGQLSSAPHIGARQ